jgi:hypothetical protein
MCYVLCAGAHNSPAHNPKNFIYKNAVFTSTTATSKHYSILISNSSFMWAHILSRTITRKEVLISSIHKAFTEAYEDYFPDGFYEFYAFVVAEFLDPRTFSLIEQDGIQLFRENVSELLLPSEVKVYKPAVASNR